MSWVTRTQSYSFDLQFERFKSLQRS
jgi:hypothetical protein